MRAINKWGAGDFSNELQIIASGKPDQIAQVTTAIYSPTGGVEITWTAPNENGSAIVGYTVEISLTTGGYWSTQDCDNGAADILVTQSCILPMETLVTTLSLPFDQLVQARISA